MFDANHDNLTQKHRASHAGKVTNNQVLSIAALARNAVVNFPQCPASLRQEAEAQLAIRPQRHPPPVILTARRAHPLCIFAEAVKNGELAGWKSLYESFRDQANIMLEAKQGDE